MKEYANLLNNLLLKLQRMRISVQDSYLGGQKQCMIISRYLLLPSHFEINCREVEKLWSKRKSNLKSKWRS